MPDDTLSIEIDGRPFQARKGQMLIEVADANAIPIPRFCYHEKLSVAANCRMCLVEVERAPKPLPACATPVMDGMRVFTRSKLARNAQKSVMEFLLINHPLDCPICDQGGECELQDVAMGYGRDVSRFNERKRVVEDKDLGPLIATDMTRCIHCTRCVRFGEEIGGMPELGATGRSEDMEIGTYITRSVDSELSGNVIDLCPVGALTSKPFRFRARAWEMAQRDGVAPHDPVGSNIHLHVRQGRVLRVVPRANESINEVWISDRDRFGFEGLYSDDRVPAPMVKRDGAWTDVSWEEALEAAVLGLREVVAEKGADAVGALASASCTLEELFLFQKLVRGIGCANVDHRVRQRDFSDQAAAPTYPSMGMGVDELERLDAALLVGSTTRKEHPMVNHRLRKASLAGASVMHLDVMAHDLNLASAAQVVVAPSKLAARLAAVTAAAARLADRQPEGLEALTEGVEVDSDAERIARTLVDAGRGAILLGPQAVNHGDAAALRGLAACLAGPDRRHAGHAGRGCESGRGVDCRSGAASRGERRTGEAGRTRCARDDRGRTRRVRAHGPGARARLRRRRSRARGAERGEVRGQPEHVPIRGDGRVRRRHPSHRCVRRDRRDIRQPFGNMAEFWCCGDSVRGFAPRVAGAPGTGQSLRSGRFRAGDDR